MSNHSPILKDTREAKGLTLEIVHEATKIPMDALKAIEQGYSVRILTPFYYRGFVKIYAEFLGLNVEEIFKAYNITTEKVVVVPPAKKTPSVKNNDLMRKAPVKQRVQAPNPAFDLWQDFIRGLGKAKIGPWALRIGVGLVVLFVFVKMIGCVAGSFKNKPKAKVTHTATVQPKPVVVPKAEPAPEKPVEEPQPAVDETLKAKSNGHKVELVVRAVKNSWIQVKADGTTVFAMTMQKGTVESWSAKDQIELSGKNIGELELEVNGKHMGSLGTNERRAKKVVITKDGLTVKK